MSIATPSQTIGPYWHLLRDDSWSDLTRFGATGETITLTGRIHDGAGNLVTDACVEIWQASPTAENFEGFGRCATNAEGRFAFKTLRPGPLPAAQGGNAQQAPHIALCILARGITKMLATRIYLEGDPGHDTDPVLNMIPPARRITIVAEQASPGMWFLDIHLQGEKETVFLDI